MHESRKPALRWRHSSSLPLGCDVTLMRASRICPRYFAATVQMSKTRISLRIWLGALCPYKQKKHANQIRGPVSRSNRPGLIVIQSDVEITFGHQAPSKIRRPYTLHTLQGLRCDACIFNILLWNWYVILTDYTGIVQFGAGIIIV